MTRHELLTRLHAVIRPRTYLEIGVREGASLTLSRAPTIGIDPAFRVSEEVCCDLNLVRATSDEFFSRPDALDHFHGKPLDFAFIDGMHLFEYALRDFSHVERHAHPLTAIVVDDVLPRDADEAARDRHTRFWAGDVFKLIPILHRYRPDLILLPLDTEPTGTLLIMTPDPRSTILSQAYEEIADRFASEDPQEVPPAILDRSCAFDPETVLAAPCWSLIEAGRTGDPEPHAIRFRREMTALADLSSRAWLGAWQPQPGSGRSEEALAIGPRSRHPQPPVSRLARYLPGALRRAIRK